MKSRTSLFAAFVIFTLSPGARAANSACEQLFKLEGFSAEVQLVDQLADLRIEIEKAQSSGQTELARVLYSSLRQKLIEARTLGIDLQKVETGLRTRREETRVTQIEETDRRVRAESSETKLAPTLKFELDLELEGGSVWARGRDQKITFTRMNGTVIEKRIDTGKERVLWVGNGRRFGDARVNAEGSLMMITTSILPARTAIITLPSGRVLKELQTTAIAFVKGGKAVVVADPAGLMLVDVWGTKRTLLAPEKGDNVMRINVSPDGKRFGVVTSRNEIRVWKKGAKKPEFAMDSGHHTAAFNTEISQVAIATSSRLTLHQIDNPAAKLVTSIPENLSTMAFSPDGKTLVGSDISSGSLFEYETSYLNLMAKTPMGAQWFSDLSFDADGKTLLAIESGAVGRRPHVRSFSRSDGN